jgi:hypothetical protein
MCDSYGRKLYGRSVHQDDFLFRWIPAPILIYALHFFVPTIVIIIAVLAYAAMLCSTIALMKPRDYAPPPFWPSELWQAWRKNGQHNKGTAN